MRGQRVKTGCHKLGLALAVLCGTLGVLGGVVVWFVTRPTDPLYELFGNPGHPARAKEALATGAAGLLLGGLLYLLMRAVAWIIAGFMGDTNSN
jgi:hypothetical protein